MATTTTMNTLLAKRKLLLAEQKQVTTQLEKVEQKIEAELRKVYYDNMACRILLNAMAKKAGLTWRTCTKEQRNEWLQRIDSMAERNSVDWQHALTLATEKA